MSMRLLRLFGGRNATAPVARERLQILLSHERGLLGQSDLLVTLRGRFSPSCRSMWRSIRTR
jgi:cell division topological specificity factor